MPKTQIPGSAEFAFIQTVASGTVHIEVRYASYDDPNEDVRARPPEKVPFAEGMHLMLFGSHVVLCGARTFPTTEQTHHYTDCFDDERLCANCHRVLHPDDVGRAFEHRQPGDTEDEY